jgi:hypothetical protein
VQAQVEVGLALAADRRGQVEDDVGAAEQGRPALRGLQQADQVSGHHAHARVGGEIGRGRHPVRERQPPERLNRPARHGQAARREQFTGQPRAEEAGAAGDNDVRHAG